MGLGGLWAKAVFCVLIKKADFVLLNLQVSVYWPSEKPLYTFVPILKPNLKLSKTLNGYFNFFKDLNRNSFSGNPNRGVSI